MSRSRLADRALTGLLATCLFLAGALAAETFRSSQAGPAFSHEVDVRMPLARRPVVVFEGYRVEWLDAEKLIIQLQPVGPVVEQGRQVDPREFDPTKGPVT